MPSTRHLVPLNLSQNYQTHLYASTRFGHLEIDNEQYLPVLDDKNQIVENEDVHFGNQQIVKTVGEWFESWRPWQQSSLVCEMADRLSVYQLEALGTSLEPVRRRDYVNASTKTYPREPFKQLPEKLDKLDRLETQRMMGKRRRKKRNKKRQSVNFSRSSVASLDLSNEKSTLSESLDKSDASLQLAKVDECDDFVDEETDEEVEEICRLYKYDNFADSLLDDILSSAMLSSVQIVSDMSSEMASSEQVSNKGMMELTVIMQEPNSVIDCKPSMDRPYKKVFGLNAESENYSSFATCLANEIIVASLASLGSVEYTKMSNEHNLNLISESHMTDNINEKQNHDININEDGNMSFLSINDLGNISLVGISHDCLGRIKKKKVTSDIHALPTITEDVPDERDNENVNDFIAETSQHAKQLCNDVTQSALSNIAKCFNDIQVVPKNYIPVVPKNRDVNDNELGRRNYNLSDDDNSFSKSDKSNIRIKKKSREEYIGDNTIHKEDSDIISLEKQDTFNSDLIKETSNLSEKTKIMEDNPDAIYHREYNRFYGNLTDRIRVISPTKHIQEGFDNLTVSPSNSPIQHKTVDNSNRLTRSLSPNLLRREKSAKTPEYFQSERLQSHGFTNRMMRHGAVHRPSYIDDVNLPLQKFYKNIKWCTQPQVDNTPTHSKLKQHYTSQLSKIWQWLEGWGQFEQTALLTTILKISDPAVLAALYAHIMNRLSRIHFINHLTDDLLLRVMTYLPASDLESCTLVCHRWYYLTNCQSLWRNKCLQIGVKCVGDMKIMLMSQSLGGKLNVDWKKAYYDMTRIRNEVTKPAVTFEPTIENPSPTKMFTYKREQSNASLTSHSDTDEVPYFDSQMLDNRPETTFSEKRRRKFKRRYTRFENVQTAMQEVTSQVVDDMMIAESPSKGRPLNTDDVTDATFDVRPNLTPSKDLLGTHRASHTLQWVAKETKVGLDGVTAFAGQVIKVTHVSKLQGHLNGVMCLSFDNKRLVSGGLDCMIRLWDVRSGRSLQKFYGHKGGIYSLDFDGSTHTLVTGSWDTMIMVWCLHSFERLAILYEHSDCVSALNLTPLYIISGSYDKTICVYNRNSLTIIRRLHHHTSPITCLDIHGDFIISADWKGNVLMADVNTGELVRSFAGCESRITSITIQKNLVCAGDENGVIYFWDKRSGHAEAIFHIHEARINKIAFHKSRIYTASHDWSVKEWDLATMTLIRSFGGHKGPVEDLKVSDKRIASCSNDGNVYLWNLEQVKIKDKAKKTTKTSFKLPPIK